MSTIGQKENTVPALPEKHLVQPVLLTMSTNGLSNATVETTCSIRTPDSSDGEAGLLLNFDFGNIMHRLDKLEKDHVQLENDRNDNRCRLKKLEKDHNDNRCRLDKVEKDHNDNRCRLDELKNDIDESKKEFDESEQRTNLRFDNLTLAIQNCRSRPVQEAEDNGAPS
jgi:septal ring factor EnvC (AmiA/AmiB activator)